MNIELDKYSTLKDAVDHCRKLRDEGYTAYFKGKGNGEVKLVVEVIEIQWNL